MHQLVDTLGVDLFQLTGADVFLGTFSELDELGCAVGCVGDPLVAGGVGVEHDLLGLWLVALLAMYLR